MQSGEQSHSGQNAQSAQSSQIISTRKVPTHASLEVSGMKMKNRAVTQIHNIAKQIHEELTEEADIDITSVDIGSLTWMITQYDIARFDNDEYKSMKDIIPKIISDKNINQSFSILDIGSVIRQYRLWRRYLPNVEIFYAVKCNPDPMILRTLANLGVGFDVASTGEINMAIETDVNRDKMIYANPCKRGEHISYARSQNVSMMTFDNENELLKIAHLHPTAKLVLRIVVDDITKSKMKFGCKFGCPMYDVENVLNFAKFHNLNIVGVSFHVGSACLDPHSYSNSIKRAREVFAIAKKVGYDCTILDIGGGFPGTNDEAPPSFADMAEQIQEALKTYFADVPNLRVIAEPGRFFATSAMAHVVRVTGKKSIRLDKKIDQDTGDHVHDSDSRANDTDTDKESDTMMVAVPSFGDSPNKQRSNKRAHDEVDDSSHSDSRSDSHDIPSHENDNHRVKQPRLDVTAKSPLYRQDYEKVFHYYIDSSLYGVFNNILFDKASVNFHLLNNYDEGKLYPSVIFGETCDSMDKITEGVELPELACGDYLYVENHGAYTIASASAFNGFTVHKPLYIFTF